MAKKKPQIGWVYSPTATKAQKAAISKQFEPVIEALKKTFSQFPSLKDSIIVLMYLVNGEDQFNLSYFRHTGKWEPLFMYNDIPFEEAKEAILEDPMFQVF